MRIRAINLMALTTCLTIAAVRSAQGVSVQQLETEESIAPSHQTPDDVTVPKEALPPTSRPEPGPAALDPDSADTNMSSPALAGVVDLVRAGVEEEVLLKHIQSSRESFNVGSDDIVFLTDVGAPGHVINAMMDRDRELQAEAPMVAQQAAEREPWPAAGTVAEVPAVETVSYAYAPPPDEGGNTIALDEAKEEISAAYFHDYLAPYGTWIDVPEYGLCWQPTVAVSSEDWRPYGDRGRWMYTENGWYWYSDYSWGWAAFHYGRWFHHTRWGWCWTPGTVWGPSWVSWRYSDPYCGWAPLPPYSRSGFYFSAGISWGIPSWCYTYIPSYQICHYYPRRYAVPYHKARSIHGKSMIRNHYAVGRNHTIENRGIPPEQLTDNSARDIRRASIAKRHEVPTRRVRGERLGDDGKTLTVYQPRGARGAFDGVRGISESPSGTAPRNGTQGTRSPRDRVADSGDRAFRLPADNQRGSRSMDRKAAEPGSLREEQEHKRSTQASRYPTASSDRLRTMAPEQTKRPVGQPAVSQATRNSPRDQSTPPRTSESNSERPKGALIITGRRDSQRTVGESPSSRVTTRTTSISRVAPASTTPTRATSSRSPQAQSSSRTAVASSRTRTPTIPHMEPARSTTRTQFRTIETPTVSRGVPTASTRSTLQVRPAPTATTRSAPSVSRYSAPGTRPSTVASPTQRTSPTRTPTRSISTPSRSAGNPTSAVRSAPTGNRAPQRTPAYTPPASTRSTPPSPSRSAPRSAPPGRSSHRSGGQSR